MIKNLDALPFIDEDCYLEPQDFYRGFSLMTGRGCPFNCSFCHEGAHTRQVRFSSVENVIAEIEAYLKVYHGEQGYFLITDDTFTLNVERVEKICAGISELRKTHDFKWFCEGHVHTLYKNPQMIQSLAKGGCMRIQLGIESGINSVLKAYGKNSTVEEIFEVVRLCRDAGIDQIYGNIILGGANFTRETFEADKKFALELLEEGQGVVELGAVTFWPLPETRMTRCPKIFGIKIYDEEFLTSVGDFPQTETEELDRLEICEMRRELQEEISAQMLKMLRENRVPKERIMNWFKEQDCHSYGMWFMTLQKDFLLYSCYEMQSLHEGFRFCEIENLSTAHPLRVVLLYEQLRRIDATTAELLGEIFSGVELEILLLTTGKLSVAEISERVGTSVEEVLKVLSRLERKHFIVYTLH